MFYDTESDSNNPLNVLLTSFCIELPGGSRIKIKGFDQYQDIYYTQDKRQLIYVIDQLSFKFKHIYLYAHNGGKWDHHLILLPHYLPLAKNSIEKIKNARFTNIVLERCTLYFRDTISFFPGPLRITGQMIGCPKLDASYEVFNLEEQIPYCCRDTEILSKGFSWLRRYMIPLLGSGWKLEYFNSLADIAYTCCCLSITVPLLRFNDYVDLEFLMQCYYGGRVISNCYGKTVVGDIKVGDIRSMYGLSLRGNLPYGELRGPIKYLPKDMCFIALYTIYKPSSSCISAQQPLVPVHLEKNEFIFVDSGIVRGVFTSVDYDIQMKDGWILKQVEVCFYWTHSEPITEQFYVNRYEERRKYPKTNPVNQCLKLIMNSAYGKFGQIKHCSRETALNRYHPIAWFCTAYSRLCLYYCKQLFKCNVYYGDTDSLYVDGQTLEHVKEKQPDIFRDELGDVKTGQIRLDHEGSYDSITVIAKKIYACTSPNKQPVVHCKGINKCTYEEIQQMLTDTVVFPQLRCKEYWTDKYGCSNVSALRMVPIKKRIVIPPNIDYCNRCNLLHAVPVNCQ